MEMGTAGRQAGRQTPCTALASRSICAAAMVGASSSQPLANLSFAVISSGMYVIRRGAEPALAALNGPALMYACMHAQGWGASSDLSLRAVRPVT